MNRECCTQIAVSPNLIVGHLVALLRLQTIKAIVDSHEFKVKLSLEECKSWTCIVLLGLRVRIQVEKIVC